MNQSGPEDERRTQRSPLEDDGASWDIPIGLERGCRKAMSVRLPLGSMCSIWKGAIRSTQAVINKALNPTAQTFLLAVACTDVAIFRTGEQ